MKETEYDMYLTSINEVENRIIDDTKFPVVRDNRIKTMLLCYIGTTKIRFKLYQTENK